MLEKVYYKGLGEHSIKGLDLIIEQQLEKLYLFKIIN